MTEREWFLESVCATSGPHFQRDTARFLESLSYLPQLSTRLNAFTLPSPVAKFQPAPALYAGASEVPEVESAPSADDVERWPRPEVDVVAPKQFTVPEQLTMLSPSVTLLKMLAPYSVARV